MSETKVSFDLVISGAGMVGLALAAALAPTGLRILLLEQQALEQSSALDALPSDRFDVRVSALTKASSQLLDFLGAWSVIEGLRAAAYTDMHVWDGMGRGEIHFSADELHEPCLGHIVENRIIHAALLQVVQQYAQIEIIQGVGLSALSAPDAAGGRQITLTNNDVIHTPLLIGADGALSKTRQLSGIGATEWDYGHHALVTTLISEQSHQNTCWQVFTEDGPLALLPLASSSPHYLSLVWSTSPTHARSLQALSAEALGQAITQAVGQRLGDIRVVDQVTALNLRQRHAHQYVDTGLALIGDAAHTIHPLAGQGVNLGFLDVASLADVLTQAHQAGESLSSLTVLRRFQRQRRAENIKMAATMEVFRRLFGHRPAPIRLLRSLGMKGLDQLAPVKNHLVAMAMGTKGNLPPLCRAPVRVF
ncbi:2-octaprenyl-3-methyl-6-methoxy-1,4-benzoquinol hydroxylase [Nitrincola tibetensis]|uniref:2-octaprenyl-3-methyl-6-methoxy-1,4-benzoquinol hydroxylase n=1 Tax=Nitrincola tibetensis TaxID=2219697 RepID=A0A364NII0_9GAMM|nr:UbiH/UbiF/VisC/COQ6 family ubiquinone biosynthesis hydroxylase [Nitrincola tibetensis]RAU16854.1 2-octaprenyl-3-methyl-6-methoxy-1,4-benzoquinol hydroxylase [Nitrincola tibetensis]